MSRTPLLLLALAVIAGGCSHRPKYKVYEIHDEFDGFTAFDMVENFLGGNQGSESVQLNISERFTPDREPQYLLHVAYEARHPLQIKQGESLVLLVDGERMAFMTLGGSDSGKQNRYGYGENSAESGQLAVTGPPVRVASADKAAVLYAAGMQHVGSRHRYRRSSRPRHSAIYRHYYRPYYNLYLRPPYPVTLNDLTTPQIGRFHRYDLYPVRYYLGYPYPYVYGNVLPRHYSYGRPYYGQPGYGRNSYDEEMAYPVSLEELRRIAGAQYVRIRVEGRFFVYCHFTEHNFAIFQRFVEETTRRHSAELGAPG